MSALDDLSTGQRVFNMVSGAGSALAPPLRYRREEGGLVGEATLGVAYEGPPSYVHGGMSALLMDQVLGDTAAEAGVWGMTAHLELDYRGPLPIGEPLVLRGRVGESNGRKSLIVGTIARAAAPDEVLVEARGLFVTPRREKLEAYFGGDHRRLRRTADAGPDRRRHRRPRGLTGVPSDVQVAAAAARAAADVLVPLRARRAHRPRARGRRGRRRPGTRSRPSCAAAVPGDVVFSEEAADDPRRLSADRVWIVDPLDGTREYGEPDRHDWAVHVALWSAGELTAAAVALPALGEVLRHRPGAGAPRRAPPGRSGSPSAGPARRPSRHGRRRGSGRRARAAGLGRLQDRRRRPRRGRRLRPRRRHVPVGLRRAGGRRPRGGAHHLPARRLARWSTTTPIPGCPTWSSAARSSPNRSWLPCGLRHSGHWRGIRT